MIKILQIVDTGSTGVGFHRQTNPHEYLVASAPDTFAVETQAKFAGLTDEYLKDFQIVQFQRTITDRGNPADVVDRLHKLGCKVALDIDDYWVLDRWHSMYAYYKQVNMQKYIVKSIECADFVTVASMNLFDRAHAYTDFAYYLPNSIDPGQYPYNVSKGNETGLVRFGFIGGASHLKDIQLMSIGIDKLEHDPAMRDKWQIVLGGYNLNEKNIVMTSKGMVEVAVPNERKTYPAMERVLTCNYRTCSKFTNYVKLLKEYDKNTDEYTVMPYRRLWTQPVETYATMYDEVDVSLVPLEDTPFTAAKSMLKIAEAGFKGKAVLYSDCKAYSGLPKGVGIKCRTKLDWYINMRKLIKEPALLEEQMEVVKDYAYDNFNMIDTNITRAAIYKNWVK